LTVTTIDPPTVTVETAVPEHPEVVPVTVYEVEEPGVTVNGLAVEPVLHRYVVPPVAVNVAVCDGQIVGELTEITGDGLIVIVYVTGNPTHPPRVGVTVIVEVIGDPVIFVAVKDGVFPAPLATSPIAVLELVQLNVAPAGVLANADAGTVVPTHATTLVMGVTTGVGLTVIV
jgi:hypothetical protein